MDGKRNALLKEAGEILARFGAFAPGADPRMQDSDTWAQCAGVRVTYLDVRRAEAISREIATLSPEAE